MRWPNKSAHWNAVYVHYIRLLLGYRQWVKSLLLYDREAVGSWVQSITVPGLGCERYCVQLTVMATSFAIVSILLGSEWRPRDNGLPQDLRTTSDATVAL